MTPLQHYLQDGAQYQARAVLMALQGMGKIEESWNKERKCYDADVRVARWENCREQGYVVSLLRKSNEQLNIAFFEHRNSDAIHAIKWNQLLINSPTIDTAKFGEVYKDKFDTSHSVEPHQYQEMASWIHGQLTDFWNETSA